MLSPEDRQSLLANAQRRAADRQSLLANAQRRAAESKRRRNRACPTCRQPRADEVADLYLGAWEREAL